MRSIFMANLIGYGQELGTGRGIKLSKTEPDYSPAPRLIRIPRQHRHCLDAGQRPLRRPEALKAEHGPGQALDPAVVLLDPVIEPAPTPVPGKATIRPSRERIRGH